MTVADILKGKGGQVVSVAPHDTVVSVARTLAQHRIGAVLVRDPGGAIRGIVSERDIVRGMAGHGPGTSVLPAEQLMTTDLVTATPALSVADAMGMMTDRRIRHLPVLDEAGGLVGMVSIGDLVKARIAEAEDEAETLKAFVHSGG